jgi:hypothetical protein
MKYDLLRPHIQNGDLILWSGTAPHSRLIRWITKSKFSHVGIAVWWGPRLMVLDSYPFRGTRARPLAHDLKNAHWKASNVAWGNRPLAFALDELDRKYSFQNLWKTLLGLRLVRSEYHCAQFAAAVLQQAGFDPPTYPPTPESLAREVNPNGEILAIEGSEIRGQGSGPREARQIGAGQRPASKLTPSP